ncbi:Gfo/Idh/MocA family oxidoreductase [Catenuloplanes sp. NPDC051500]|uniref:Gfo/Idh/MocA family oxidoreductase n=1 Tax=Catenuloplanes sp. NPDC051500 TaxID=3363959 RepID=UPI0037922D2F
MTTSFALVGFGFRAATLHRVSTALDDLDCVGAVVRSPRALPVPSYPSLSALFDRARPDFVVTAVPPAENPALIRACVARGMPVLAETPPAPDLDALRALWADAGDSGLVQVAEQYPLMPSHAARAAAVRAGLIGTPTQVQVSSTQLYHAVALIRGLLGAGHAPAVVRASRTEAPLLHPLDRGGWTGETTPRTAVTTIATLDFGAAGSGLYDFTTGQTRNQLRFRRLLVRGTHGELRDDEITHLTGPRGIARTPLIRRQTGHDLDLNGYDTSAITFGAEVLWSNPDEGRRWNDDEIATAALLSSTAAWVRGDGPPPYPLAEAAQDHLIGLAIEESATRDRPVMTTAEAWSRSG